MAAVIFPSAWAMQVATPSPIWRPVLPWVGRVDLVWLMLLIAAVLMLWYLGQVVLALLLIREKTAFCPRCVTRCIRPAPPRGWELSIPFLPAYDCENCGKHFFRGRKPRAEGIIKHGDLRK